jgi:hypothetical protein
MDQTTRHHRKLQLKESASLPLLLNFGLDDGTKNHRGSQSWMDHAIVQSSGIQPGVLVPQGVRDILEGT